MNPNENDLTRDERFQRRNFSHAKETLAQLGVSSFVEQQKKFPHK